MWLDPYVCICFIKRERGWYPFLERGGDIWPPQKAFAFHLVSKLSYFRERFWKGGYLFLQKDLKETDYLDPFTQILDQVIILRQNLSCLLITFGRIGTELMQLSMLPLILQQLSIPSTWVSLWIIYTGIRSRRHGIVVIFSLSLWSVPVSVGKERSNQSSLMCRTFLSLMVLPSCLASTWCYWGHLLAGGQVLLIIINSWST